jgi:hypothetical protein
MPARAVAVPFVALLHAGLSRLHSSICTGGSDRVDSVFSPIHFDLQERKMSRLDAALARLSQALDRLEEFAGSDSPLAARDSEVAQLRGERELMLARIAALEEETSALSGLTAAVETRLDGAIAEIRAALSRS